MESASRIGANGDCHGGPHSLREIAGLLDELAVMPALDRRVLQAAAAPDHSDKFERLSAVLRADPLLAVRVLRVANSAYFGRSRTIGSIEGALALLGTEAVSAIALASSFDGAFVCAGKARRELEALRRHGLWTATLARRLAARDGQADCSADEAFIAGLMHDLGIMLHLQFAPDADPRLVELDHAVLGAALLSLWNMPPALIEAVRGHHHPDAALPAADVRATLWAADALANWAADREPQDGVSDVTPEQLEDHLGLSHGELVELTTLGVRDAQAIEVLLR